MNALGHHIRLHLVDNRVIALTPRQRRLVTRVVLAYGRRYNLLAMSLADSHLHGGAICDRRAAGRFAHSVEASLKQRLALPVGFVQYEPKPIRSAHYLRNTFPYILGQHQRHGLPAAELFESSNAPDLLALRVLGRYTIANVRRWLPRVTRAEILEWLGMPEPQPADGPLDQLREATLAASGLEDLRGVHSAAVAARRAMVEIIGSRLRPRETAELLGLHPRTLRRLRKLEVDPRLVSAIRLQLGVR